MSSSIRIDGNSAARRELSDDFQIAGFEECEQIIADRLNTIFMKVSVIAETEEIKFHRFAFHHFLFGDVIHVDFREVGLTCFGTQ